MCEEVGHPTAPEDWYADSPIYVGNEMPIGNVGGFASGLAGYENIWIDQEHNGWVTVRFVDADVESYQRLLEEEFPDVAVVAVEMAYTHAELNRIRKRIHQTLPEDMDASNMFETRGVVEVWVGRLTPDRVAVVEKVVGDDSACLEGLDPATAPQPGPQPAGGDGWTYLAEVDSLVRERPTVIADTGNLKAVWEELGAEGPLPTVEFGTHIVVGFSVRYSGSCPETRFDDVLIQGDVVHPVISHISESQFCSDDANPRTDLISIKRDILPSPPFRISYNKGTVLEVQVTVDLRQPTRIPSDADIEDVPDEPPRTATPTPEIIGPDSP